MKKLNLKTEKREYFCVKDSDLACFIKLIYNLPSYSLCATQEYNNDSCYSYFIKIDKENFNKYDQKKLQEFINGQNYSCSLHIILEDLCRKGYIVEGNYLVEVCW